MWLQAFVGGSPVVTMPTPPTSKTSALFSTSSRYWSSNEPFCKMRRLPFQSTGRTHAATVNAYGFSDALSVIVIELVFEPLNDAALFVCPAAQVTVDVVPVLPSPDESDALAPPVSSSFQ